MYIFLPIFPFVWSRCDQQLWRLDERHTEAKLVGYELWDGRSFSLESAQLPCSGVHSAGLRSRSFGEGLSHLHYAKYQNVSDGSSTS